MSDEMVTMEQHEQALAAQRAEFAEGASLRQSEIDALKKEVAEQAVKFAEIGEKLVREKNELEANMKAEYLSELNRMAADYTAKLKALNDEYSSKLTALSADNDKLAASAKYHAEASRLASLLIQHLRTGDTPEAQATHAALLKLELETQIAGLQSRMSAIQ